MGMLVYHHICMKEVLYGWVIVLPQDAPLRRKHSGGREVISKRTLPSSDTSVFYLLSLSCKLSLTIVWQQKDKNHRRISVCEYRVSDGLPWLVSTGPLGNPFTRPLDIVHCCYWVQDYPLGTGAIWSLITSWPAIWLTCVTLACISLHWRTCPKAEDLSLMKDLTSGLENPLLLWFNIDVIRGQVMLGICYLLFVIWLFSRIRRDQKWDLLCVGLPLTAK